MAKVSVIIPVYNTAEYMDQCIDSVLAQTMTDIEIMLVDDGSTDGISGKKCDEYAGRDSRVRVIHKENGGLQSAWIAGTAEATSDYVSYVDSDDWIDADMMEETFILGIYQRLPEDRVDVLIVYWRTVFTEIFANEYPVSTIEFRSLYGLGIPDR